MATVGSSCAGAGPDADAPFAALPSSPANTAILEFFFPGFGIISSGLQKYLGIDLNVYIPAVILVGAGIFSWRYFSDYIWGLIEAYLMSSVEIRTDDEIYNMLMAWVADQNFSKKSRRFIANTNLNSRSWYLWRWSDDDDEETGDEGDITSSNHGKAKKALSYTPSFGSHSFWYNGRLLRFRRSQDRNQQGYLTSSEREEISIACFGRSPAILKQLLLEARAEYLRKDTKKTMIYRGGTRSGTTDPSWQRCMARAARPFSTVILNEKKKQEIIDDVAEYLSPATRNWYSNRGIPWRRGYLLAGPPGTGKSSLSLALAGHFKMRIYIVSLSSPIANEESLMTLFTDLPQRCVVLLEDIDTAGLTHTREENGKVAAKPEATAADVPVPGQVTMGAPVTPPARLSLSGLLNILDGVASQEGRVLIMTTNHIEKLDRALIRPGRVDMIVQFSLADKEIISAIFRAIHAPLEGDDGVKAAPTVATMTSEGAEAAEKAAAAAKLKETLERVDSLSHIFAEKIPAHEFSPAEIQGFLLKHKRDPQAAIDGALDWVQETRKQKKEKELREAEEKRAAEKKEKEEKEKVEKEKSEKEKEEKDKAEKEKAVVAAPKAKTDEKPQEKAQSDKAAAEPPKALTNTDTKAHPKGPASDSGYDTPGET
ncbi:mitochondrial chaperone BCS1 [Plectosphaerella plurivora]|uniref:Mitochondrial chaperone BCS1 n=1 Tax=Plectosphaerella plurivora TaxID=936078 RepID=A0A9P8V9D9_9PEZI|nr:mitochondrial chaperone BCS1 [Plectosphaerella plurivora]